MLHLNPYYKGWKDGAPNVPLYKRIRNFVGWSNTDIEEYLNGLNDRIRSEI